MPTEGWSVELRGHAVDLEDIKHDLTLPFDPWSELYTVDGQEILLLRTGAWREIESAGALMESARRLLEQLNGAKLVQDEGASPLTFGSIYRFNASGERVPVTITAVANIVLGPVRVRARGFIQREGEPTPPPEQSPLQRRLAKAERDSRLADILTFVSRSDNWFDLFKAMELIESVAGRRALEKDYAEWRRVRQTTNSYRHAPTKKNILSERPATLEEAIALVRKVTSNIL